VFRPRIEPCITRTQVISVIASANVFHDFILNLLCSLQQLYWPLLCVTQNHTMKLTVSSICTSCFVGDLRYLVYCMKTLWTIISLHVEKRVYKLPLFWNTKIVTETYEQKIAQKNRKVSSVTVDALSECNCSQQHTIRRVNEIKLRFYVSLSDVFLFD
jgi:hypothetical protein